jgi:hypothetical protein
MKGSEAIPFNFFDQCRYQQHTMYYGTMTNVTYHVDSINKNHRREKLQQQRGGLTTFVHFFDGRFQSLHDWDRNAEERSRDQSRHGMIQKTQVRAILGYFYRRKTLPALIHARLD